MTSSTITQQVGQQPRTAGARRRNRLVLGVVVAAIVAALSVSTIAVLGGDDATIRTVPVTGLEARDQGFIDAAERYQAYLASQDVAQPPAPSQAETRSQPPAHDRDEAFRQSMERQQGS